MRDRWDLTHGQGSGRAGTRRNKAKASGSKGLFGEAAAVVWGERNWRRYGGNERQVGVTPPIRHKMYSLQ